MTEIEQMAKLACTVFEGRCSGCPCKLHSPCAPKASAERLYTAGYRKASEVAKEVIADIRQSLINMVLLNITGEEYDLAKAIADVEKKYTEERNDERE